MIYRTDRPTPKVYDTLTPRYWETNGSEKWKRIQISVLAYAYEYEDNSIVDDTTYDVLAKMINLKETTSDPEMDAWFRDYYLDYTGQWIRNHPNLDGIKRIYNNVYRR